MKIRIHLEVNKLYQIASANVIECGESKNNLFPKYEDTKKRYEIIVDVPHVTDAEELGGTFREV